MRTPNYIRGAIVAGVIAGLLGCGAAPSATAFDASAQQQDAGQVAFAVHHGDTVAWLGDSVTYFDWFAVPGGMVDQINANGGAITVVNRGVSGWFSTQIQADAANVVALKPNAIILDIGINDAIAGDPTPSQYRVNIDSALDTYQAGLPGVQILLVSPLLNGEQWTRTDGGFALDNPTDPAVDAVVAQAQASATAHGVPFVSLRPAALQAEVVGNTPAPGAPYGFLMDSTLRHPTVPTGQLFMCNQVMPYVTVLP